MDVLASKYNPVIDNLLSLSAEKKLEPTETDAANLPTTESNHHTEKQYPVKKRHRRYPQTEEIQQHFQRDEMPMYDEPQYTMVNPYNSKTPTSKWWMKYLLYFMAILFVALMFYVTYWIFRRKIKRTQNESTDVLLQLQQQQDQMIRRRAALSQQLKDSPTQITDTLEFSPPSQAQQPQHVQMLPQSLQPQQMQMLQQPQQMQMSQQQQQMQMSQQPQYVQISAQQPPQVTAHQPEHKTIEVTEETQAFANILKQRLRDQASAVSPTTSASPTSPASAATSPTAVAVSPTQTPITPINNETNMSVTVKSNEPIKNDTSKTEQLPNELTKTGELGKSDDTKTAEPSVVGATSTETQEVVTESNKKISIADAVPSQSPILLQRNRRGQKRGPVIQEVDELGTP